MKIEIEISEEIAACLWDNNSGTRNRPSVKEVARRLLVDEADNFRRTFPDRIETAVARYRDAHGTHPTTSKA